SPVGRLWARGGVCAGSRAVKGASRRDNGPRTAHRAPGGELGSRGRHSVTAATRVGARIAELEEALEEGRQHSNALAAESADAPPTVSDLATALDRLPLRAEWLHDLPSR